MTCWTSEDERWMSRALALAVRGQGHVEPNPVVGCVIVKGDRLLGAGYHRRFGGPHAEIEALRRCGRPPRGATAYVTLEPCCHFGKTPPCTDALIAAGVGRVVAAIKDPHDLVAGKGFAALRRAGIAVNVGLLAERATELNAPYFRLVRKRRPWVILKWAQSLDGKIATRTGDSKWITDEACRTHAHRTRGRVDAIIVGIGTVLRDNPLLTCRLARPRRIATRVVLDADLHTPLRSRLVRTARQVPTWVFHARQASPRRRRALEKAGCQLQVVPRTKRGLALPAVLDRLGAQEMTNVLVEGGGRVLGNFFDQGLADEFHIYIGRKLIGGATAPGPLCGQGIPDLTSTPSLSHARLARLGDGWFVSGRTE